MGASKMKLFFKVYYHLLLEEVWKSAYIWWIFKFNSRHKSVKPYSQGKFRNC